ncbi:fibronectin type III domain-containing protein [Geomonas sp. RF6]|uniref:fibronectin type III domain-containing protein n=1 Tax=Geomonas sp. RF6 TaxID=2897342 RepID=UPI001E5E5265|nr:fibronectin type III domain-containing protein [Geomonas sp. RF6]UFS70973.1 fibronectin type III domain-containing protein [Geomonas sp. RF6]
MKQKMIVAMLQKGVAVLMAAAALAGCGGGGGSSVPATQTVTAGTVTTTNGTTAAQLTVATPAGLTLSIPSGTTLTDASGTPVSGSVSTSVSYSTTASDLPAAAATLPAGTALAGFTNIDMGTVKSFSQPVALTMKVAGVSAGDTVELYSFSSSAWKYEGLQTVSSAGTITPSITHLSVWAAFKNATPHPGAPAGVQAIAGDGKVTLNWTAVPAATSYNVYYGKAAGVSTATGTKVAGSAAATLAIAPSTPLDNGVPYYFIVTAVNATGESLASAEVSATPLPVAAAPKSMVASGDVASVKLAWLSSATATSYNVYQSSTTPVTAVPANLVGTTTATTYTVSPLTNGQQYYFAVTAVNSAGESLISSDKAATPAATAQAPGSPASVTATVANGQVTVDWAAIVPNATSYNVYYLKSSNATTATVISTGTKMNTATAPAVLTLPTGTYSIVVTAANAAGESGAQTSPKKATL